MRYTNLSSLWDGVFHDARYIGNREIYVLLSEIVFATITIFMVVKTFFTIIYTAGGGKNTLL